MVATRFLARSTCPQLGSPITHSLKYTAFSTPPNIFLCAPTVRMLLVCLRSPWRAKTGIGNPLLLPTSISNSPICCASIQPLLVGQAGGAGCHAARLPLLFFISRRQAGQAWEWPLPVSFCLPPSQTPGRVSSTWAAVFLGDRHSDDVFARAGACGTCRSSPLPHNTIP